MFKNCLQNEVATFDCIPSVVGGIIQVLLMFLGAAALFYLLWGSLKFVMSGGDPKAVGAAKNTMTYALIGLVVVLLSFAILKFLGSFLGIGENQLLQFGFGQ